MKYLANDKVTVGQTRQCILLHIDDGLHPWTCLQQDVQKC